MNRGAIAELDRTSLRHNLCLLKQMAPGRGIIAVVKADAYGHGAVEAARILEAEKVAMLAVAFLSEARTLRDAGITSEILVLFDRSNPSEFLDLNVVPVIHDIDTARRFSEETRKRGIVFNVHLKVDTGMGRLGFPLARHEDIFEICGMEGIAVTGLMTHFSEADLADKAFANEQLRVFSELRQRIMDQTGSSLLCHCANSAAVFSLPDALFDAVRPGLSLYGYSTPPDARLRPVMQLKTSVLAVREVGKGTPLSYGRTYVTSRPSRIAVLAMGYADGYNRLFSNRAHVLIRGKRVPVVGRVCMDLTLADVTDIEGVKDGDEVVLLGRQGAETITADELASMADTIPYEILTSLGPRAQRNWMDGS